MKKLFKILFFVLILVALAISSAFSDTIYLKNGKVYEGRILKEDDQKIALKTDIFTVIFYKKDIKTIERFYPSEGSIMPEGKRFNIIDILKQANKISSDKNRKDVK